jgi:hypothetical protein
MSKIGEYYSRLKAVTLAVRDLLPAELLVENTHGDYAWRAVRALAGAVFCKRCGGSGHYMFNHDLGHDHCFTCGGHGLTRAKLTPELVQDLIQSTPKKFIAKAQSIKRGDERKAEREAEKSRKFFEAKRASQEEAIAHLTEEQKAAFMVLITGKEVKDEYDEYPHHEYVNSFIHSLADQWHCRGRLSEKQIACVIREAEKIAQKEEQKKSFVEYTEGERTLVTGRVQSIKQVEVPQVAWYSSGWTNKVVVKSEAGQFFVVKTTADRLLNVFRAALEENKEVTISGVITWISPEKNPICFTSRGMKLSVK